jgi:hypothetical protein
VADGERASISGGAPMSLLKTGQSSWRYRRQYVAPPEDESSWRLRAVVRKHFPKTLSSSSGVGSQERGFRRPALPNANACKCLGWRDYDDSEVAERGKTLTRI